MLSLPNTGTGDAGHTRMSYAQLHWLWASMLSTVMQMTIASTSFNEATETADIVCSQKRPKWCVRTDSTDPFTWYEAIVVSGELDNKPFPAPPSKVKAPVDREQIIR